MKNGGLMDIETGSGRRAMPYDAALAFGGACRLC